MERLLAAEEGSEERVKRAVSELKGKIMDIPVPVALKVSETDGDDCWVLSVTKEELGGGGGVPQGIVGNHPRKKASTSLDPGLMGKQGRPEYCGTIAEFVGKFAHFQVVQNATQTLVDPGKVRSCFAHYLEIVREEVSGRALKGAVSEEVMDKLLSEVEDHVMRAMYGDVFPTWASKEDISLHSKCRSLSSLTPQDFNLPSPLDPSLPSKSFPLLDQLSVCMTPREKLLTLVEFTALVLLDLDSDFDINKSEKTEETLRYLSFLVVKYAANKKNPPMLHSHLNFIFKFGTYRKPTLREAISFSLVKSSVEFIQHFHSASSAASQSRGSFSTYL